MRGHPGDAGVLPASSRISGSSSALLYFGLAVLLVLGMHATHVPRNF